MEEQTFILSALIGGVVLGVASLVFAHKSKYLYSLLILIAVPLIVALVEFNYYPSQLEGVATTTGLITMIYSVMWGPYWLLLTVTGWWLGRTKPSP